MANAIAQEIKENELADGFKRLWAGPVRECVNPGCQIQTRSENGECAWCLVKQRAEARVARGEVEDITTRMICGTCMKPFVKVGSSPASTCPACQVASYNRTRTNKSRSDQAQRKIDALKTVNSEW